MKTFKKIIKIIFLVVFLGIAGLVLVGGFFCLGISSTASGNGDAGIILGSTGSILFFFYIAFSIYKFIRNSVGLDKNKDSGITVKDKKIKNLYNYIYTAKKYSIPDKKNKINLIKNNWNEDEIVNAFEIYYKKITKKLFFLNFIFYLILLFVINKLNW